MNYRPDIDGLRAVAVLSVVLCHAGIALPGGYVGVDVFFVISGFLIASLMLKDLRAGTFSLAHFWERRIRRIVPALFVVVASTLVLGWFFLVPRSYEMLGRSIVHLMTLRSNQFFARQLHYFGPNANDHPLLHTWSLSIEEQFYLFIPLLFWGVARMRRLPWLGPIVACLALASLAWSAYGTANFGEKAYYALSTRTWELCAGVLTALYVARMPKLHPALRQLAAGLGLGGIVLPTIYYTSATPFPGLAALPPVLGTALLIAVGSQEGSPTLVYRLLASRPAVSIGLISYSLYLWHWPLLVVWKEGQGTWLAALGPWVCVLTATVLAVATYRFVEQPFRRGNLLATRSRLVVATATAFGCLIAAGIALRSTHGLADRLPEAAQRLAVTAVPVDWCRCVHRPEDVPNGLLCVGATDQPPRVLFWGDSHAGMVMPAVHEMCSSAGIAAQLAMVPSHAPVLRPGENSDASKFAEAILQHVATSEIEVVVLAGIWSSYFANPEFTDRLLATIDALQAAGCRVYFLKDVPVFNFDIAAASIRCQWRGGDVQSLAFTREQYAKQNRWEATVLPQLIDRGVSVLDPIPFLCGDESASVIPICDAGGSFYYDENHLTLHGALRIRPVFTPLVDAVSSATAKRPAVEAPASTLLR